MIYRSYDSLINNLDQVIGSLVMEGRILLQHYTRLKKDNKNKERILSKKRLTEEIHRQYIDLCDYFDYQRDMFSIDPKVRSRKFRVDVEKMLVRYYLVSRDNGMQRIMGQYMQQPSLVGNVPKSKKTIAGPVAITEIPTAIFDWNTITREPYCD